MRKRIFIQWAVPGILVLIGLGIDLMPQNESWVPSAALWGIAGIWFMVSLVYWLTHRQDTSTTNDKGNAQLLDDVKTDILNMNQYLKEVAVIKAKAKCPRSVAMQISDDAAVILGDIGTLVLLSFNVYPLIKLFKKLGDVLDSNNYGLKVELENNKPYNNAKLDIAQKQVRIKASKKKMRIIQNNIDMTCSLIYGLNSSIIIRGIMNSLLKSEQVLLPAQIKATLEEVEASTDKILPVMLNDLESEWKISKVNDLVKEWRRYKIEL